MSLFQFYIEPRAYSGTYRIYRKGNPLLWAGPFKGRSSIFLPTGEYYWFAAHGANANFGVDGTGNIIIHSKDSLQAVGNTLLLQTVEIEIDPTKYEAPYKITGVNDELFGGRRKFNVVKGVEDFIFHDTGYTLELSPGTQIRFNVDAKGEGNLNQHYAGAGCFKGSVLTLKTVLIDIQPANYRDSWQITGAEKAPAHGGRPVRLIPHGKGYCLSLRPGGPAARFCLGESGDPLTEVVSIFDGDNTFTFRLKKVG